MAKRKARRSEINALRRQKLEKYFYPITEMLKDKLVFDINVEKISASGVGFGTLISVESIIELKDFLDREGKYRIFISTEFGKPILHIIPK